MAAHVVYLSNDMGHLVASDESLPIGVWNEISDFIITVLRRDGFVQFYRAMPEITKVVSGYVVNCKNFAYDPDIVDEWNKIREEQVKTSWKYYYNFHDRNMK